MLLCPHQVTSKDPQKDRRYDHGDYNSEFAREFCYGRYCVGGGVVFCRAGGEVALHIRQDVEAEANADACDDNDECEGKNVAHAETFLTFHGITQTMFYTLSELPNI